MLGFLLEAASTSPSAASFRDEAEQAAGHHRQHFDEVSLSCIDNSAEHTLTGLKPLKSLQP